MSYDIDVPSTLVLGFVKIWILLNTTVPIYVLNVATLIAEWHGRIFAIFKGSKKPGFRHPAQGKAAARIN